MVWNGSAMVPLSSLPVDTILFDLSLDIGKQIEPLGGGIGSGGSWGASFSPGSFLSEVAIDSWNVKTWVETGIVGLVLHIATLLIILGIGMLKVFKLRDPNLKQKMMALTAGYFGIVVASYGN